MPSAPLQLLLIEDSRGDADLIQKALAKGNDGRCTVVWAESLQKGVQQLNQHTFDALLLDLQLPDSQGLATITRIVTNAPTLPIVVLTATEDDALALQALQHGAQDYICKGYLQIYARLLERAIRYAIERKRAAETLRRAYDQLEHQVQARTAELVQSNEILRREIAKRKQTEDALRQEKDTLETMNKSMVGREERIVELKREVNALLKSLGQSEKYS